MKKTYALKVVMGLWLLVMVSLVSIMNVSASEDAEKNTSKRKKSGAYEYVYSEVHQGVVITKYTGKAKKLKIPATIDGMPVKVLAPGSFTYNSKLQSVNVPEGIIEMDDCFSSCNNLQYANVPEGVTSITHTFASCDSLKKVELPKSLEEIGDRTFQGCKSMETIKIPNNVKRIGYKAFYQCQGLKSVKWSKQLRIIETNGFAGCKKLQSVKFQILLRSLVEMHLLVAKL